MTREQKIAPNRPLSEALATFLDDEDEELPCLACHL